MRLKLLSILLPSLFVSCSLTAMANPRIHRGPTSPRPGRERISQVRPKTVAQISPERASVIQNALVKAGYLKDASGTWDSGTQTAMEKLQADNGWQIKVVPDARALIKLGLGPGSDSEAPSSNPSLQ